MDSPQTLCRPSPGLGSGLGLGLGLGVGLGLGLGNTPCPLLSQVFMETPH